MLQSKLKTIKVEHNQNILDITLQEYGDVDSFLQLCLDNGLELGADVEADTELIINSTYIKNKRIVEYYKRKKHKPASGEAMPAWILQTGYWRDKGIWIDTAKWID